MAKRSIFDELIEDVAAMKSHREGKVTLRSYKVEAKPLPKVDSKLIRETREKLRCSRAVFARKLHINERLWRSGNRGARNLIRKPLRWCSLSADTQTHSYVSKSWQLDDGTHVQRKEQVETDFKRYAFKPQ